MSETHQNYMDSTRTLVFYDNNGFVKNTRTFKLLTIDLSIGQNDGFSELCDKCEMDEKAFVVIYHEGSDAIKEKGSYCKGQKIGKWSYYDENGRLVKEEKF